MNRSLFSTIHFKAIFSETVISLRLAVPLMASFLVQQSSGFIGTAMVAHLGEKYLAASPLTWSAWNFAWMLVVGVFQAVGILVAQSFGAKDEKAIGLAVSQGFLLSILFSIPTISFMWFTPILFRWSNQSIAIINIATHFLHALSWCIIPVCFYEIVEQFLIGIGKTRLVLIINLFQVPITTITTYCLVFGRFRFPAFGIYGIAYSLFIVFSLLAIVLSLILYFSPYNNHYCIFSGLRRIRLDFMWELIRVGFPIGCSYMIEVGSFTLITLLMGHFSSEELAAHQIAVAFWAIALVIIMAISQVTSMRASQAVGRNDRSAVKLSVYINLFIGFFILAFIAILYGSFQKRLLFSYIGHHIQNYGTITYYTSIFIGISFITLLADHFRMNFMGGLRGLKDTRFPMIISAIGYLLVVLLLAKILCFHFHLHGPGLWISLSSGPIFCALVLAVRFIKQINHLDLKKLVLSSNRLLSKPSILV